MLLSDPVVYSASLHTASKLVTTPNDRTPPGFLLHGMPRSRENRKLLYWAELSFFRESVVLIPTLLSNSCKSSDFTPCAQEAQIFV